MGSGFFPLDEELGLLPGTWSPALHEALTRLGARLPFEVAAQEFTAFTKVPLSETTVRRLTLEAGAAYVQVQAREVERLERAAETPSWERPRSEALEQDRHAALVQMSVDGAFVPLVGGGWTEVKTVALGEVQTRTAAQNAEEEATARGTHWSYFSRCTDAETFTRGATAELQRRGVAEAQEVVAVNDGAEWIQGFVDTHRADAVRILDFMHAMEYVSNAAKVVWGEGKATTDQWVQQQRHELKHGQARQVLRALAHLPVEQASDPAAARAQRAASLQYLTKRLDQLQYAHFVAQGYPIGSGSVESANKLVVEARLKGSGMHWARAHVDPVVALRTALCSKRWAEAWLQVAQETRARVRAERRARQLAHRPAPVAAPPAPVAAHSLPAPKPPRIIDGRPTADHPWRRPFLAGGRHFLHSHPKL